MTNTNNLFTWSTLNENGSHIVRVGIYETNDGHWAACYPKLLKASLDRLPKSQWYNASVRHSVVQVLMYAYVSNTCMPDRQTHTWKIAPHCDLPLANTRSAMAHPGALPVFFRRIGTIFHILELLTISTSQFWRRLKTFLVAGLVTGADWESCSLDRCITTISLFDYITLLMLACYHVVFANLVDDRLPNAGL